jgi:hypothetical protein
MSRLDSRWLLCAVWLAIGCNTPEAAPGDRPSPSPPEAAEPAEAAQADEASEATEPVTRVDPLAGLGDVADLGPAGEVSLRGKTLTSAELVDALERGDQDPSSLIVRCAKGDGTAGLFKLLNAMAQALPSESMEEIRLAFTVASDPGSPAPPPTFQGPPAFVVLGADGAVSFSQGGDGPHKLIDPAEIGIAILGTVAVDPDTVFVLVVEPGAGDELVASVVARSQEMKARYVYRFDADGLRTVDVAPDR